MTGTTKQTQRITPRVPTPEFLKIDRQAELRELRERVRELEASRQFYRRRCAALEAIQDRMRDPERKAVCDILANGSTRALEGRRDREAGMTGTTTETSE